MKISKILKISISAILSLAIIASITVIPSVSAENTETAFTKASAEYGLNFNPITDTATTYYSFDETKGSLVFKNTPPSEGNVYSFFDIEVPVVAGKAYDVSYNISTTDETEHVYLRYRWGGTKYVSDFSSYGNALYYGAKDTIDGYAICKMVADAPMRHKIYIPADATYTSIFLTIGVKNESGAEASVYFDNFSVTEATNLIPNGDLENGNFTGFANNFLNSDYFITASETIDDSNTVSPYEGKYFLKATCATRWAFTSIKANVEANTRYVFSMYVYQPDSNSKLVLKLGTGTNTATVNTYTSSDYNIWEKHTTQGQWFKITKEITTTAATFVVNFALSAGTTYVDNISLKKVVNVSATAETGGTVAGLPADNILAGDSVTLTATPESGYWFDGWYNGDVKVSGLKKYSFTVTDNSALTAKFVPANNGGIVENGSFEANYDNGWSTDYASDFAVVNAADEAPAKAIDGSKILKIAATDTWRALNQNLTLEAKKEYVISFWYYRLNNGYISLKFGNSTSDNALVKESWLNNDATNKWVYKTWTVTTTDDATIKLFLCAFDGTAYIDDVRIAATDSIGNLIENGDMSNAGKALNAWTVGNSSIFAHAPEAEGYTGTGALKIEGSSSENYANAKYTLSVKANTDYVFRFYAKNSVAGKKAIYKILGADNTYMFNNADAFTNGNGAEGNGADWGKNEWRFNSGENTTLYLYFVEIDNVTYIDDLYLGEAIEATCASSKEALGTVSASKAYVGEDDEVTYTATATAGGKFLGWCVGNSETLVEGETYTYKGFDDLALTAVFEAALGNVNEDSAIDATDMTALRKSILGSADYTELGDMNGDEQNDIRDLVALCNTISK